MSDLKELIERLEGDLGYSATWRASQDAATTLKTQAARIAELEAALMIYAEDDNWTLNSNLDPNGGNFCGASFARQALRTDK